MPGHGLARHIADAAELSYEHPEFRPIASGIISAHRPLKIDQAGPEAAPTVDRLCKDAPIRAAGGIDRPEVSVGDMRRGPRTMQREGRLGRQLTARRPRKERWRLLSSAY